jgi:hypothetical protein
MEGPDNGLAFCDLGQEPVVEVEAMQIVKLDYVCLFEKIGVQELPGRSVEPRQGKPSIKLHADVIEQSVRRRLAHAQGLGNGQDIGLRVAPEAGHYA